ncbi:MAG: DUF4178 domain-containing protein [Bacteroidetes bacterium]|jgi:hypothetical protein|nr:DUF4178 domain-containing protein [Bacteroidota bacterium]MBT6687887.1 DUF4178 domain-containing protein [Bacteroidota bacterium]MBT7142465.1 DUF4178 domain-containing protein [Bacteroidota bacterium]MBT7490028.1 DUF4178 domain-containing protein [Bacteroidota bacterium]
MGIFDVFKKKEKKPEYDPTNISVLDLQKGFVFEYDLKTWIVKAAYDYDWGNNFFSREYKIDDGEQQFFLSVENDDEISISISKKIKIRTISEDIPEYISENDKPPKSLIYKNIKYFLDGENPGFFKDCENKTDDWAEVISWTYYDETDENILNIEQWGDDDFESSVGTVIKEFEISNILPG